MSTLARRYRVAWLLTVPSPMQRSLLEAISRRTEIELEVIHCTDRIPGRVWNWNEKPGSYDVRWLKGINWRGFCLNPGIIRLCMREDYDLFVVNAYDQPTLQLAMLVLSVLRKPWAIAAERPGLNQSSRLRRALRQIALLLPKYFASGAIGTGSLAKEAFERIFADGRPSYSIPYVFNMDEFLSMPVPAASNGSVRFLFSGQLVPRKGIDVLCEAAGKLFESGADASLSVLGDGPERFRIEELKSRFPAKVAMHGFVSFNRRAAAYHDADVFVFPSRHDGWAMVVHEAMARGLPVISSAAVGAAYDLVEHGINGFMVRTASAEEYYRAMQFFVERPVEIGHFGARAKAKASVLTPDWGAEEFAKILVDLNRANTNLRIRR